MFRADDAVDAGLHPKEISAYWPKWAMATVAEFACYLMLDDADMFNMIVVAKTTITLYIWTSTKKQWVSLSANVGIEVSK